MRKTVFYSWQSDLPNNTNRGFIEDALKRAAEEIGKDADLNVEPVIDRDTKGVSGSPNIASIIFDKISAAHVFVADISIVSVSRKKRLMPNPNVLIELGYALNKLGYENIILVFNTAFGEIVNIPFDLKMRRILTYTCSENESNKSLVKSELVKDLKAALIASLSTPLKAEVIPSAITSIENKASNRVIVLRNYLSKLIDEITKLQPKMYRDGGTIEDILDSLPKTESYLAEFAKLSETIAIMNDIECAQEVFKWFGKVHEKYNPEGNKEGRISDADGDYFKFIGHELFVMFVAPYLKEEKWDLMKTILGWNFKSEDKKYRSGIKKLSWMELVDHSPLFANESRKRNRLDLRADILHERHTTGKLSSVAPFNEFAQTDFFLSLYGPGKNIEGNFYSPWYPYSLVWMDRAPLFLTESEDYPTAMKILGVLGISDVEEFKRRLKSNRNFRSGRIHPIHDSEIEKIGSKGGARVIHLDE